MSIVEAASVKVATMADGTLRITVDVEPTHAQAAFALFGAPGTPMALAALKVGHAAVVEPEPEKPKGGPLAKLAGQWCHDEDFMAWLLERHPAAFDTNGGPDAERAARALRRVIGVDSRVELDQSELAAEFFHQQIRLPYQAHLKARA